MNTKNSESKKVQKKQTKKVVANKKTEIFLTILMMLAIISFGLGLLTWFIVISKLDTPIPLITKYSRVVLWTLPIPVLATIVGIIYKVKGLKANNVIIVSISMIFLILAVGIIVPLVPPETPYEEINIYKEIIGVDIPPEGLFVKQKWDESSFENRTTNTIKFTNTVEAKNFEERIKNNGNWIIYEEMNPQFKDFFTLYLYCRKNDTCYYSFYIKELDSYNIIPEKNTNYYIYAMMYSSKSEVLTIEEYLLKN